MQQAPNKPNQTERGHASIGQHGTAPIGPPLPMPLLSDQTPICSVGAFVTFDWFIPDEN